MKKRFRIFLVFFLLATFSQAQTIGKNGTVQMPNLGFESWNNLGSESVTPEGWNSFMQGDCSGIACQGKAKRLDRTTDKRPGSSGSYSLRIYSNSILGIVANGNITTGKVNLGSTDATNSANHNSTKRGQSGFNMPFTAIPDSLVIWVKFVPRNASSEARISAVLHNNNDTRDPHYNASEVVAVAALNFKTNANNWERISIPFVKTGNTMDARYILITFTTNKTPGGGSDGDQVFFDDMIFVYNPTASVRDLTSYAYGVSAVEATPISIPFRLTGTFTPNNNLPDNEIRIEMSNASGSFANPIVLGKIVTDESGVINGNIPAGTPAGMGYKLRIVSTNYPLTSLHEKDIEIIEVFKISALPSNHRGSVNGNTGVFRAGTQINLTAMASSGNSFTHWAEKGSRIEEVGANYSFALHTNRSIEAHFDTNRYQINIEAENGQIQGAGTYIHNEGVSLSAFPDQGFRFVKYAEGTSILSTSSTYTFQARKNMQIKALFEAQSFPIQLSINNTAWGSASGTGTYKYKDSCTLSANPKSYCEFVAWMRNDEILSTEAVFRFQVKQAENIRAVFKETTYQITIDAQPLMGGSTKGQGVYAATSVRTIQLQAQPAESWEFVKWVEQNTETEISSTLNPYPLVQNSRLLRNIRYTALFKRLAYNVNIAILPDASAGKIEGEISYPKDEEGNIAAIPSLGYEFVAWVNIDNGDTILKSSKYSFISSAPQNLQAVFRLKEYKIELISTDSDKGRVEGSNTYSHFSIVKACAKTEAEYELRAWENVLTGDTLSTDSCYVFTAEKDLILLAHFSHKRKNIKVICTPIQGGNITGAGLYEHNASARLTALPAKGYSFVCWEDENGQSLGATPVYSLMANQNINLRAVFSPNKYKISLVQSGAEGELAFTDSAYSLIQSAELEYDSYVEIRARSLSDEYRFMNWTEGDKIISIQAEYSIKVNDKRPTYIANFSNKAKGVQVQIEPVLSGIVSNVGNHPIGSPVEMTAISETGYHFKEWRSISDEFITEDSLYAFVIKQDTSFKAIFEINRYPFHLSAYPSQAAKRPLASEATYDHGTFLDFTAEAQDHYSFIAWINAQGDTLSTDKNYVFSIEEPMDLIAHFDSNAYHIELDIPYPTQGKTEGAGSYKYLSLATLKAFPEKGFCFKAFIKGEDTLSKESEYEFIVEKSLEIKACFDTAIYQITPIAAQPTMGKVFGGDTNFFARETYVKAQAEFGHQFLYWLDAQGNQIGDQDSMWLRIEESLSIYAHFSPILYELTTFQNNLEYGQTEGDNIYGYGQKAKVMASPMQGYEFVKWVLASDTNIFLSNYPMWEFIVSQDTSVMAIFSITEYKLDVLSSDPKAGMVEGGNDYYLYQTNVEIRASENPGYRFVHWSVNGVEVSQEPVYTISVNANMIATAIFEPLYYQIEVRVEPEICGQVVGSGLYPYDSRIPLVAKPAERYFVQGWQQGDWWLGDQDTLWVELKCDTVFSVIFRTDTFSIQTRAFPEHAGTTTGDGIFLLGQECVLKAEAVEGYHFTQWKKGEEIVAEQADAYLLTSASDTYTAYFEPNEYKINILTTPYEIPQNIVAKTSYLYGDITEIEAFGDSIYTFVKWMLEGEPQPEITEKDLLQRRLRFKVLGNAEVKAVFTKKNFEISAEVYPAEAGKVQNTGIYDYGTQAFLLALPAKGYQFRQWTLPNQEIVENDSLYLNVNSPIGLMAVFERSYHSIILASYPENAGYVFGSGTYRYGDTAIISAVAAPGYEFTEWMNEKGRPAGSTPDMQFVVESNVFFKALYQVKLKNEQYERWDESKIKLYPNPTSSYVNIQAEGIDKIEIYSAFGNKIIERLLKECEKISLDLSSLPTGLYIYKTFYRSQNIHNGKIIKK